MLVEIVVLVVFFNPLVLGQSLEFEQECHVLTILENLETRLKLMETLLEQEKANSKKNQDLLEHQNVTLEKQTILLEHIIATLEQQEALLGHQNATLGQQEARISELEAQLNASKQSTDDHRIGFTVRHPAAGAKMGSLVLMRFTVVVSNAGGGYNSSTGEFTCTVAGQYYFSLHLIGTQPVGLVQCSLYRNDHSLVPSFTNPAYTAGYYATSTSLVVHLSPGDVVYPGHCTAASTMHDWSSFSGFLTSED